MDQWMNAAVALEAAAEAVVMVAEVVISDGGHSRDGIRPLVGAATPARSLPADHQSRSESGETVPQSPREGKTEQWQQPATVTTEERVLLKLQRVR